MDLYVGRVNKINGEYVVDKFIENYGGSDRSVNNYVCERYQEPETIMLCLCSCSTDLEAIEKINNKWENLLYYETICKITEIFECKINDEDYLGFEYEDGYRYLAKKSFIYSDSKTSSKFYKRKYQSAKKHKKVVYREGLN